MSAVGEPLAVGIIGCGRMAREYYLPACRQLPGIEVTSVVDVHGSLAQDAAMAFSIPHFSNRIEDLFDRVPSVIILLPHHLHAPIALDFLRRGIHVLCEKPLATSFDDAIRMVEASEKGGAALGVSMMRRSYPASRLAKRLLELGVLGRILRIDAEEGFLARRPPTAGWLYDRNQAGGGVLISNGIHLLDVLLWWFAGDAVLDDYEDDGASGVEANASLRMTVTAARGHRIPATVELSLLRRLRNTVVMAGEHGTMELPVNRAGPLTMCLHGDVDLAPDDLALTLSSTREGTAPGLAHFVPQIDHFRQAIAAGRRGFLGGECHLNAMRLISHCYAGREVVTHPWETNGASS